MAHLRQHCSRAQPPATPSHHSAIIRFDYCHHTVSFVLCRLLWVSFYELCNGSAALEANWLPRGAKHSLPQFRRKLERKLLLVWGKYARAARNCLQISYRDIPHVMSEPL